MEDLLGELLAYFTLFSSTIPPRNQRRARHFIKPMKRFLAGLLIACALFGQATNSPPAAPTAYTVASIKPNKSSDDRFMLRPMPGGGLSATGVTLKMLIGLAYGVFAYQISGGPAWISTERWDIEAKTDGVQGPLPRAQSVALLRALIENRFQLKARRESKEMPIYALVVTKNGPKLLPSDPTKARPSASFGRGSGIFTNSSMAVFATRLSEQLGRPVIDQTDLKGGYDFTLEWTPAPGEGGAELIGLPPRAEPPPSGDSNGPSIFTALQELGLKLESTKGPAEILIIDNVERPSEN
jgi:bla regulator protein blaR1